MLKQNNKMLNITILWLWTGLGVANLIPSKDTGFGIEYFFHSNALFGAICLAAAALYAVSWQQRAYSEILGDQPSMGVTLMNSSLFFIFLLVLTLLHRNLMTFYPPDYISGKVMIVTLYGGLVGLAMSIYSVWRSRN